MMRNVVTGACALAVVAAGAILVAAPVSAAGKGRPPKVAICHLGKTIIEVPDRVVAAHIAHGDYLVVNEVCDGFDNDCDGRIDEGDVCVPAILVCDCFYPENPESPQRLTDCLDQFDQCGELAESLCSERCSFCFGTPERLQVFACEVRPDCRPQPCIWVP
ncbi:MAG TPA: hypothetical protein VL049_22665 [Candidatus Dormibacteraeota bacterium]|nr:hypothetical protein [Candidatus Dormibacteraeota bacterium]